MKKRRYSRVNMRNFGHAPVCSPYDKVQYPIEKPNYYHKPKVASYLLIAAAALVVFIVVSKILIHLFS